MNATKLLINVLPTATESDDISSSVVFDGGNANFGMSQQDIIN